MQQTNPSGLSEQEVRQRLARDGPNRLPAPQHRGLLTLIGALGTQPMLLLLLACAVLYALLGSVVDSLVLSVSIVVVAAISVYQELRTQRTLEALRDMASPRSTVVRDGAICRIGSEFLVEGDLLVVQEGDRLACDAWLVESHGLRIDESLLTGESVPVDKAVAAPDDPAGQLHAGTLVVQGDGVAIVSATGRRTALGKIGGSLAEIVPRSSRLHRQLQSIVRWVAVMALFTCAVASTLFALREGSWQAGLLVGLTLAMSLVPEEFAVVWAVMQAMGAWRLARSGVLTRQPQAIEALGTTTVLCVDKTGTLTRNRMELVAMSDGAVQWQRGDGEPGPGSASAWGVLECASLASVREALEPMDKAIFDLLGSGEGVRDGLALHDREGVAPGRPYVLQRWRGGSDPAPWAVVKGAPEAVLALCDPRAGRSQALLARAAAWAAQGWRVIAVARQRASDAAQQTAAFDAVGLLAFEDPLREGVREAIAECRGAGVRVVMITGDALQTAVAIARDAGLVGAAGQPKAMSGAGLDELADTELDAVIAAVDVFARVTPAQKLRIVQSLQRRGEVVAMTGDGVNDGPALRAADIGVAMGERGTDVAREAAGLVLLDDRFGSLVDGLRAGRRIFANLQRALGYLFAVHVPIVGLSLLPLLGGPMLLLPIHVVLLELIIDPACSLVFEAAPLPEDGMRQPPRPQSAALFGVAGVVKALAIGFCALSAVLAVQWAGRRAGWSHEDLRLAGLGTVVLGNLVMVRWFLGASRPGAPNRRFGLLLLVVSLAALLAVSVPALSGALGFARELNPLWAGALLALPAAWATRVLLAPRQP